MSIETQTKDLEARRVLVVDDSATIRRAAADHLAALGCDVATARDGFDALGRIMDYRPDAILLDVLMPWLDGYRICALVKDNGLLRATLVIMLSSRESLFDRARGRVAGADGYLTKPFTRSDLLGALHRHGGAG